MKQGLDDFIVESTPVLDLKKQSLDSSPGINHISEPGWDADRTEVYADIDESDAVACLKADTGESYPITTFPFVIGRGTECDLVLQGKGISRKHVEIVFQSGRFVINDLESLNGLKVNGYKVARVILEEDDVIKLGDISLVFNSGSGALANAGESMSADPKPAAFFGSKETDDVTHVDNTFGPSPVKKILTSIVLLLALALFAGAGYIYFGQSQSSQLVSAPSAAQTPKPSAPASTSSVPAPQAPTSTGFNTGTASTVDPALGNEKAADLAFSAPPPPSSLAPPPSISDLAPPPSSSTKAAEPKKAPVATQKPAPKKPAAAVASLNSNAQQAIRKARQQYLNGDGGAAMKTLKPYFGSAAVTGNTKKQVVASYQDIEVLYDQYNLAQSSFSSGDKDAAFSLWIDFMAKEQRLFSGQKSAYTRQIANKVVEEYVARGNRASEVGDYHSAYNYWQQALKSGDSVVARIGIDNLNTKAQQLYRQALRLEYVNANKAKSMWREVTELLPPGTDYHTKASSKLAWYDKWGS